VTGNKTRALPEPQRAGSRRPGSPGRGAIFLDSCGIGVSNFP